MRDQEEGYNQDSHDTTDHSPTSPRHDHAYRVISVDSNLIG